MRNEFTLTRGDAMVLVKAFASLQALVSASGSDAGSNLRMYDAEEIIGDLENFLTDGGYRSDSEGSYSCCGGDHYEDEEEEEEEVPSIETDDEISASRLTDLPPLTLHDEFGKFKGRFLLSEDGDWVDLVDKDDECIIEDIKRISRTGTSLTLTNAKAVEITYTVKRFPPEWTGALSVNLRYAPVI